MKRVINCAAFLIRETVKRDKTLILLDIIVGFMRESQTLVNVFLPAAILSLILLPDNINKAVIVIAAVNAVLLGTALTSKLLYSYLSQNLYSFFQPSFALL